MRYALKEAKRQKSVLTNRKYIRGIAIRMSSHSTAKSEKSVLNTLNKSDYCYVDVPVIGGRKKRLPGEVLEITS